MVGYIQDRDIATIASLEREIFRSPWSDAQIREHLRFNKPIFVATNGDGQLLGYLILSEICGEWEILKIATSPKFLRQGVGASLIGFLLDRVKSKESIFLEVRASNSAAISLYRSAGFLESGLRRAYYSDGEDALCMVLNKE
jgi:ribosomal-protein-alanine N-acetyltransferase